MKNNVKKRKEESLSKAQIKRERRKLNESNNERIMTGKGDGWGIFQPGPGQDLSKWASAGAGGIEK